ncbi:MAG: hypothetical protein QXK24_00135 [Ignisphaera sp.]
MENRMEIFKKWSEKIDVPVEEIVKQYNKYLEELKDEKKAFKKLRIELSQESGSLASSAVPFYGYLIGDSGLYDIIDNMKQIALNMYNDPERREEAISRGMVTEDGQPLDWRRTVFGRPNPNFGMPLTGAIYERDLIGIVSSTPDFESPKLAYIIAEGSEATNLQEIELFNYYKFRATVRKKRQPEDPLRLAVGRGTVFRKYETNILPVEIANKIECFPIELETIETIYKDKFEKKRRTSYLASFRGDVNDLSLEPINGFRRFYLVEESSAELAKNSLLVRIPSNIPIIFTELDTVQVFGRLFKTRNNRFGLEAKAYICC